GLTSTSLGLPFDPARLAEVSGDATVDVPLYAPTRAQISPEAVANQETFIASPEPTPVIETYAVEETPQAAHLDTGAERAPAMEHVPAPARVPVMDPARPVVKGQSKSLLVIGVAAIVLLLIFMIAKLRPHPKAVAPDVSTFISIDASPWATVVEVTPQDG